MCSTSLIVASHVQVVRDAAKYMQNVRSMGVTHVRDATMSKLQTLMNVAACSSLREKLGSSPVPAPRAAPSRDMLHAVALSFALAEAGTTSADYVQLVAKLMHRELQTIPPTPGAPFSVASCATVMQALAYSGSANRAAKLARHSVVELCSSSLPPALRALQQPHSREVPTFTIWDWARYFVPKLGLLQGTYAALKAPAPVLHMQGLHVELENGRNSSQFSLPRPVQAVLPAAEAPSASVSWREYAAWGHREPVDTLVLLLHSFLVAHLRQSGLSNDPASLDPALFSQKYLASFDDEDKRFVRSIYSALHVLDHTSDRPTLTRFPGKLLLADRISQKVGLVGGPDMAVSDPRGDRAADWRDLRIQTRILTGAATSHREDFRNTLRVLQRLSPHQPPLLERLFSSRYMVRAVRRTSHADGDLPAMRKRLLGDVAVGGTDTQVCRWLMRHTRNIPGDQLLEILRVAVVEDAVHLCTWLRSVPEPVIMLASCCHRAVPSEHRDILQAAVSQLPSDAGNEQVAVALQNAVLAAPMKDSTPLAAGVYKLAMLAHILEPLKEIQAIPMLASEVLKQMRHLKTFRDIMLYIRPADAASVQLQHVAERVCHKVTLTGSQYNAMMNILDRAMHRAGRSPRDKLTHKKAVHVGTPPHAHSNAWDLVRDVKELFLKAGTGEVVQGCRVTAELADQSAEAAASPQGRLHLPERLLQTCNSSLSKAQGRSSEMQARPPWLH
jgi:hypothetical protein